MIPPHARKLVREEGVPLLGIAGGPVLGVLGLYFGLSRGHAAIRGMLRDDIRARERTYWRVVAREDEILERLRRLSGHGYQPRH